MQKLIAPKPPTQSRWFWMLRILAQSLMVYDGDTPHLLHRIITTDRMDQPVTKRSRRATTVVPPTVAAPQTPPTDEPPSTLALLVAGLVATLAMNFAIGGNVLAGLQLVPRPTPREPSHAQLLATMEKIDARLSALEAATTNACREVASACIPIVDDGIPTAPEPPSPNSNR
ncbi:hypothetical protein HY632_02060 [Candidatus Uhrbacteria bacterium]|nr:hypothetical protein [Candidatus Uhrbacteria bacterium]